MDYFNIIILIIFTFIGYFVQSLYSGKYPGDKIEKSLRFLINDYYIHIHHWLWSLVLIILFIILGFYNPVVFGILIGFTIQGLTYKDRFVFFYHKDNCSDIYNKWKSD